MDFELDDSHADVRNLAAGLLDRAAASCRATASIVPSGGVPGSDAPYDVAVWKAMAQAGLLDACLPDDAGGAGLGAVGLAVLLREVGAHVAEVPAFATLALGAFPVARHGTGDLARHALAGVAAIVSGVLAGALKLTAGHVKNREQFGRPLAEFQAVTMQVADVYIASRALDAAMWASCWRLGPAAGLGHVDADELLAVAAWHAAGPALRALYACQHLHGGLGVDVTYPLHRHFAWGTQYAQIIGGEQARLDSLGDLLAGPATPPPAPAR